MLQLVPEKCRPMASLLPQQWRSPWGCTGEGTKSGSPMAPRACPMDVSVNLQGCSHIRAISSHSYGDPRDVYVLPTPEALALAGK